MKRVSLVAVLLLFLPVSLLAQLKPEELTPDSYVKLVMKDSSQFYVTVLGHPLPDRIVAETRYGRLEIPTADIAYAIDYRYNWVKKEDLRKDALRNAADMQEQGVRQYLSRPKLPDVSTVATKDHNIFTGHRYLFNDSAHVVLSTRYGNLFFKYPDLDYVDNWTGQSDRKSEFFTSSYVNVRDPLASQAFLMPTARAFGGGHGFVMDYMVAGLQLNYGLTDWLSLNGGGVAAPFLPTPVATATAGLKITPLSSDELSVSLGAQGVYSKVRKITRIGFPYVVATYGTWESELTLLGGLSYQSSVDSLNIPFTATNSVIGVEGDMRVGENLKASIEFYFVEDFGIVPTIATMRYFTNEMTIDVGIVFSLYKAGSRNLPTLGEYVFNTNFDVIPMVSGSYHF
jgi:hypothetical protein